MSDYDSDYEDDQEEVSGEIDDEDLEEESESNELDEDSEDVLSTSEPRYRYSNWIRGNSDKSDITNLDINEIKSSGKFTPEERAAEYRRRGKSPSGVIDGEYNDEYRGNDEYNDEYRDWDANA